MHEPSDEQLLADHQHGDKGAFDALVRRHVNELYGFLARFVGSATAADDIVQDTFVQVHLAAATFDPGRSFRPWLYTIAANKARDYLRSRGRRQELSLDSGGPDDDSPGAGQYLEADDAPQTDDVIAKEQRETVRALVDRMPEHFRTILLLGYFQQLPYAEIAEVLDIPVGTVKSRLHAAVNYFADLWRRHTDSTQTVNHEDA